MNRKPSDTYTFISLVGNTFLITLSNSLISIGFAIKPSKPSLKNISLAPLTALAVKATTGVVVTASHNPRMYNGYKAYWDDGAQVTEPHDVGIIEEVNKVTQVKTLSKDEAIKSGMLKIIDKEIFIKGLYNFGVTYNNYTHAYLSMNLSNQDLISIGGITNYKYIQEVNISKNELSSYIEAVLFLYC